MVLIETECVGLRRYEDGDESSLVAVLTDPGLMAFAVEDRALSQAEAHAFLMAHCRHSGPIGLKTVCLKASDTPIGFAGYRRCTYLGRDDVEFGWVIARAHHGYGYATALGRALIVCALSTEGLNLSRVLAACHPENAASEHILRDKLRMTFRREVDAGPNRRRRVYVVERPV